MAKAKRVVFFGSPEFAVPSLEALAEAGREPILVVSQPARRAGRGSKPTDPPVAAAARERGLEVAQPKKVSAPEFLAAMTDLKPDLFLVVAFGQIFPAELLDLPKLGCVNLHASLLPKYRGASPIQAAIRDGRNLTGLTTMQMEEELDSGPILLQEKVDIGPRETAGALSERLSTIGAELLVRTVTELEKGKITPRPQKDSDATYAARLVKEDGKLDWDLEAGDIYNMLRAYTPWPGIYTLFRGEKVKILSASPIEWEMAPMGVSGTFLGLRQGRMAILSGDGTILGVERLQRPGKSPVRSADFLNGERLRVGERFV
jgi:methionyl-tRNA formyltransferase